MKYQLQLIFKCGKKFTFTKEGTLELGDITGGLMIFLKTIKHNIENHKIREPVKQHPQTGFRWLPFINPRWLAIEI